MSQMAVEFTKLELSKPNSLVSTVESEGILRPITSNDTGRYERTGFAEPYSRQITSGLFTCSRFPEPDYLPPQWSAHIHPEGQLYFYRSGPLRVVTEEYLYQKAILGKVLLWIKKVESIILERNFAISTATELFIKLEDEDCAYYLVDYSTRALFWLEDVDMNDVGLPAVVSVSHLNILCEELYWGHIEHFPSHFGGLSRETVDSLICVFTHAICDQMTSRVSTFSYSKQECEEFVSLLKNSRDHLSDGHIVCTVARLWNLICRNRYLTHHGQEFSRLSRDQAILYDPEMKHQWVSTVASRISFKTSDRYLARLNDVFVDHLVYSEQWKSMVNGCLQDWQATSRAAFIGLMLHIFFLNLGSCLSLAVASASLFVASLLASTLLAHRYEPLEGICAAQAMDYLESIESPMFKFQFVALVFALPHALNLWGTLLVFVNCICMLALYFGSAFAGAVSAVGLLAVLMFQWTTSETFNMALSRVRAKFLRTADAECTSMV